MDYSKLISAIDAAEQTAYGSDDEGQLNIERARAIDAYLGKNLIPAPEGRSQVVDRSVYETIQWIAPSLARIFANGDDIVELPPLGPEDEAAAKQEGQYLNYLILQKNNWFEIFNTVSKDAMLMKSGYIYVCKDKRRIVEIESYERQTAAGLALLLEGGEVQVLESKEYPDPDFEPQEFIDPATGLPSISTAVPMLYDIKLRRVKEMGAFTLKALPPERTKVSEKTPDFHLTNCPYFEFYDYCTISDLRAEGFDVEDDIASDQVDDTEVDLARDVFDERSWDEDNPPDPSMRRVRKRYIWIRHDYDEDGIAELQYVVRVGGEILHREEINTIPVAAIACDPMPHRHPGLSVAESVMDIQDIKTDIMRQGLDNLRLANNGRTYVNDSVINLDDLLISRPGGIVRGRGVFGQDIAPIPTQFMFPQAVEGLAFMDNVRDMRAGVNRNFTGLNEAALGANQSGTAINQLSSMAAQRVEQIARVIGSGIKDMCAILHELVLKSGHQKDVVRLSGKWVEVDPATWKRRSDFRICVGFSAGNKDAQISRLMMMAQMQEKALAGGLPICTPKNAYETAIELTKAADFSVPDRFWTDPSTVPPAAPPQPDVTVMAAEQLRAQSELQKTDMQTRQKDAETRISAEIDKYRADLDSQTKIALEQMRLKHDAALAEFNLSGQAGMKQIEHQQVAEREQAKAKPANDMAQETKQLAKQLQDAIESLQGSLATVLTAKRTIRRGKDGRAEGVDLMTPEGEVLMSQSVQRGSDGRVLGTQ